jgi:hypothetical protein
MNEIDAELHPALASALAGLQEGVSTISTTELPADNVEDWSLARFATSGQYRRINSKVLGEIIILAADNAEVPDFGNTVVYRAAEARLLVGKSPEEIRAFHKVKVYFDGIIEKREHGCEIDAADLIREAP